ncbi:T9SS type A sorting domain-containing protein [Aggregatimonas sangjinii]|uniref:T9SS type A sorting domain-containing protein n=1 Tax=Aggregatimonas sangjinii TaxID=2583587 RepID=A0A5B7SSB6_9FLAO|nr:T9SS type A sorting domain-containing protein [Aggregatimonas sangjinii]QCX01566.1 T9SS type A sorting domain-containing protein [Aggregatimonas sangjinii]
MNRFEVQFWVLMILAMTCNFGFAQTSFCGEDPPNNPFLADSPWPTYHRNSYRQASTCLRGPEKGDSLNVKARANLNGGTSPWVYLSEKYPEGERVLLQSNTTHVFKFLDNGSEIVTIDSLRIDFDPVQSFGWNFLLTKNKTWFTYDPKYDPDNDRYTRLFKLSDADTSDPYSDIVVLDTLNFGDFGVNRVQHFGINYEGHIVFNSDNDTENGFGTVGVISQDFEVLDTFRFPTDPDEITNHNAFPIDEDNSFFITTNKRIIKFDWDGESVSIDWEAAYDFVGDGPTGTFAEGSGTTPTFLGWGAGNDKLVVMSDGHAKNNLVAFWREIPSDWEPIPGTDPHYAGRIELPAAVSFNNLFQSIENSPTAYGYDIAIAQFNGFLGYECDNIKGVQKVSWDTESNSWNIAWVNSEVNMNGVLTYAAGSNLVYSSGKESDCNYYFYGLNWDTGELEVRLLLGPEGSFTADTYYDAGNNCIIAENGDVYFPGGSSLVKVEIVQRAETSPEPEPEPVEMEVLVYPVPSTQVINISFPEDSSVTEVSVFTYAGKFVETSTLMDNSFNVGNLASGLYFLSYEMEGRTHIKKFIRN